MRDCRFGSDCGVVLAFEVRRGLVGIGFAVLFWMKAYIGGRYRLLATISLQALLYSFVFEGLFIGVRIAASD